MAEPKLPSDEMLELIKHLSELPDVTDYWNWTMQDHMEYDLQMSNATCDDLALFMKKKRKFM